MTSITIYDGANTIGGNKIFIEEKGTGVFLDFGKNFKRYCEFYKEYLKSSSTFCPYICSLRIIFLNIIKKNEFNDSYR